LDVFQIPVRCVLTIIIVGSISDGKASGVGAGTSRSYRGAVHRVVPEGTCEATEVALN